MAKRLNNPLQSMFPEEIIWKIRLLDNWTSIVGFIGTKVVLLQIREPAIILGVPHPAWAQELHFMKSMIQDNINTFLGSEYIKNIFIQIVPPKQSILMPCKPSAAVQQQSLCYIPNDQEKVVLGSILDETLKDSLISYMARCNRKK